MLIWVDAAVEMEMQMEEKKSFTTGGRRDGEVVALLGCACQKFRRNGQEGTNGGGVARAQFLLFLRR